MQLQMAFKGLQLCRRSSIDTAIGTVRTMSVKPLDETYDGSDGGGPSRNFEPINLSYRALEWRGKEQREKETRSKTPLLIHHSLYGRKENWNPISDIINRTTQRKIINIDGRNHGESPFTKEMSLPLMAKDIVHLMKQLKEDKMSYLGHSMGGRIGILLALTQPQLIDRMIVVDSSVIVNENSRRRWSALRQACSSLMKIEDKLKNAHGYERLTIANKVQNFYSFYFFLFCNSCSRFFNSAIFFSLSAFSFSFSSMSLCICAFISSRRRSSSSCLLAISLKFLVILTSIQYHFLIYYRTILFSSSKAFFLSGSIFEFLML